MKFTHKEHNGLKAPLIPPRDWDRREVKMAQSLRRPGETWMGPSGTWFYKRPDGKVVRVDAPDKGKEGTDVKNPKKKPTGVQKRDDRPVGTAEARSISPEVLSSLAQNQIEQANNVFSRMGYAALPLVKWRLLVMDPQDIPLGELSEVQAEKARRLAPRIASFDPDYAADYAPVVLDFQGNVVDGKVRLAAHLIAGLDEVLVLMPRVDPAEPQEQEIVPPTIEDGQQTPTEDADGEAVES